MTMIVPSPFGSVSSRITSSPFAESKLPVGSSAKINFSFETARARAYPYPNCGGVGQRVHSGRQAIAGAHIPVKQLLDQWTYSNISTTYKIWDS